MGQQVEVTHEMEAAAREILTAQGCGDGMFYIDEIVSLLPLILSAVLICRSSRKDATCLGSGAPLDL